MDVGATRVEAALEVRAGADGVATERVATDGAGTDRAGTDRAGTGRSGAGAARVDVHARPPRAGPPDPAEPEAPDRPVVAPEVQLHRNGIVRLAGPGRNAVHPPS